MIKYIKNMLRIFNTKEDDFISHAEFVEQAYLELLGRKPDETGKKHFLQALNDGYSRASVLFAIAKSDEFIQKVQSVKANEKKVKEEDYPAFSKGQAIDPIVLKHNQLVKQILAQFERHWALLYEKNRDDYLLLHKQRYAELFASVGARLALTQRAQIVELGPSLFLPMYKKLFPHSKLITIDRPLTMQGATSEWCISRGADSHYHLDLNEHSLISLPKDVLNNTTVVVCTELIEHLLVEPVSFIRDMLTLLKVNGFIYLTTPNFLSFKNLEAIKRGENPQPVFPGKDSNTDGHYHFREYCFSELQSFIQLAGGSIEFGGYSQCWDARKARESVLVDKPEQASNLVFIFSKKREK